jgi:hypothetical protein
MGEIDPARCRCSNACSNGAPAMARARPALPADQRQRPLSTTLTRDRIAAATSSGAVRVLHTCHTTLALTLHHGDPQGIGTVLTWLKLVRKSADAGEAVSVWRRWWGPAPVNGELEVLMCLGV